MPCLNENQVVAFFSPERPASLAAEVDAHSAGCEACRALLAEYAQLSNESVATSPHLPSASSGHVSSGTGEKVELVQRLAQAQARKYIGKTLQDKWTIEELLGTGGMAHVFAARHRNGRRVAIKVMRPELVLEGEIVKRFLREGYVANKIDHPSAVVVLDDDVMEDGTPFLVMELLSGRTLRARLADGPLPVDEALRVVAQVLDLLAVAHDRGIVHRDLKPDNVFETDTGVVKVLDFGIARLKEHARPELETRSGTTMGTVGYMPPEQARGLSGKIDARSDVWAIGATLFSLLTGRTVHRAATTNEALLLAMTTPVPPMRTLLPGLGHQLHALLDTALAFDREQRYPSARAMKQALDAAMLGLEQTALLTTSSFRSTPPAPPAAGVTQLYSAPRLPAAEASPPARRRRPAVAIGAGVGLAGAIVLAGWGATTRARHEPAASPAPSGEGSAPAESSGPGEAALPGPGASAAPVGSTAAVASAALAPAPSASRAAWPRSRGASTPARAAGASRSAPAVSRRDPEPPPPPPPPAEPAEPRDPLGPRR